MKERNVVEAIIVNKNNEVLLQKKTNDYKYAPGVWTFFGGEIENNESNEEALKREIKEEINYDIKKFKFFKIREYKFPNFGVKGKRYIFRVYFDNNISQIKLTEGGGFGFFSESEVDSLKMQDIVFRDLKEFFNSQ